MEASVMRVAVAFHRNWGVVCHDAGVVSVGEPG